MLGLDLFPGNFRYPHQSGHQRECDCWYEQDYHPRRFVCAYAHKPPGPFPQFGSGIPTPSPTVVRRANSRLKTGRWDLEMEPARQTCGDAAPSICNGNINFKFSLQDNHDSGYTMDISFQRLKKATVAPLGRSGIVHAEWQSVKDPKNLECRTSDTIEAWIGVGGEILVNE